MNLISDNSHKSTKPKNMLTESFQTDDELETLVVFLESEKNIDLA
jgi:hypothetical protein